MQITDKTTPDPVATLNVADAYMRWALLAAEDVVGKEGLNVMLRDGGLERFIDNYPPDAPEFTAKVTNAEYTQLNTKLLTFYGRAGKGMVLRIGRLSAKHGIDRQSAMFGVVALLAAKLLPIASRQKMVLERMQDGLKKLGQSIGQDWRMSLEDRGEKLAFIYHDCSMCAGKTSDTHVCWLFNGVLQEATHWITGQEFDVEEVACRAQGAEACVWEISKKAKS